MNRRMPNGTYGGVRGGSESPLLDCKSQIKTERDKMFIRINENVILDPVQVNAMCAWGCKNYHNTVTRLAMVAALTVDPEIKDRIKKLYDKLVLFVGEEEYPAAFKKVRRLVKKDKIEYIFSCRKLTGEKV